MVKHSNSTTSIFMLVHVQILYSIKTNLPYRYVTYFNWHNKVEEPAMLQGLLDDCPVQSSLGYSYLVRLLLFNEVWVKDISQINYQRSVYYTVALVTASHISKCPGPDYRSDQIKIKRPDPEFIGVKLAQLLTID